MTGTIGRKLLLVDDEVDLLELFSKRLTKAGFDVTISKSGEEALEKLGVDRFDVVICDINMPGGMSGFEVLEFVHNSCTHRPPFIFVTGHGEGTPEMERALSMGVDGVFSKPISSRVLVEHLKRICGISESA